MGVDGGNDSGKEGGEGRKKYVVRGGKGKDNRRNRRQMIEG
jgi:hypothetical protein